MAHAQELFAAIAAGDAGRVESLVTATPELAAARNESGASAPLLALYHRRDELAELLATRKEAVEPLDVFEAAAFGRAERLGELLDGAPALADAFAPDGFFPLGLACFFGREPAVKLLLERGADPVIAARNPMKVTALHAAAAAGNIAIQRAVVDAGGDVNARQQQGFTALHEAARSGQLELATLLLDRGADPAAATDDGRTPLDVAREANQEAMVSLLESRGAPR